MSTEAASVDTGAIAPDPLEIVTEKDHFLQHLVNSTNLFPENNIGIILQMKGMLISGTIISGDKYFEKVAELLTSADDMRKHFISWGEQYKEDRAKGKTDETKETVFIHLEDCTFHGPIQLRSLKELWRGRISEVEGFMIGRLAAQD